MRSPKSPLSLALLSVILAVFAITSATAQTERVLHNFGNGTDGSFPLAGLISDTVGNLYGTTQQGGAYNFGTVFEMERLSGGGWGLRILHSFNDAGTGEYYPDAGLI